METTERHCCGFCADTPVCTRGDDAHVIAVKNVPSVDHKLAVCQGAIGWWERCTHPTAC